MILCSGMIFVKIVHFSRIWCLNLNINGQLLNQTKKMQNFGMTFLTWIGSQYFV